MLELVKWLFGVLGYWVEVVVLGNWWCCLFDVVVGWVDLILVYCMFVCDCDLVFFVELVLCEEVVIFYNC